jgi:hypothetical protein
MAIVRKYGGAAVAGLAQKAGENIAQQKAAELSHQTAIQGMQQASEKANLQLQIKAQLEKAAMDQQTQIQDTQQKLLFDQARDRAMQDWEFEKMQTRSMNDFALEEKQHTLKKEYYLQKEMQDQIELDNKIKQLDKDFAEGRISKDEYNQFYGQVQYGVRNKPASSEDRFTQMAIDKLQGKVSEAPVVAQDDESPAIGNRDVAIQPPVATQIPADQKAFNGSLWWKKPNPAVIDPALKAAIQLPSISANDKAAILYLLQFGANSSPEILEAKGKIYKKLMTTIKG